MPNGECRVALAAGCGPAVSTRHGLATVVESNECCVERHSFCGVLIACGSGSAFCMRQ